MGESTKALCALVLLVGILAGAFAWHHDHPDTTTWGFRIGAPAAALLMLVVLLKLQFRVDLAHDYLRDQAGTYFNRNGFCFACLAAAEEGIGYMDIFFQNQRDRPCVGRVALRPARGLFGRTAIQTITCTIECAPAAFGRARVAIPISRKLQGKRQSFEVGASVHYPHGKGKRLRFHDGVFLRANSKFGDSVVNALAVAGTAAGSIILSRPAATTLCLPENVAEEVPDHLVPEVVTLWQLGDSQARSVAQTSRGVFDR